MGQRKKAFHRLINCQGAPRQERSAEEAARQQVAPSLKLPAPYSEISQQAPLASSRRLLPFSAPRRLCALLKNAHRGAGRREKESWRARNPPRFAVYPGEDCLIK